MQDAAQQIAEIVPAPDVSADIKQILLNLRTKALLPEVARSASGGRPIADELHTVTFQLMAVNLVAVTFWAVISVLTGALLLIYQNPAFGTNLDLMFCVAWGLGISAAGGASPQTTPSNVAGMVGIKLPGSSTK
jgi:hypothetical protein